jgi:hypothetical protein
MYEWESNPSCPHDMPVRYRLRYCERLPGEHFSKSYEFIVKKLENKIVYYKQTAECPHVTFWPGCQERSTTILQNRSQIGGLKSTGSPCKIQSVTRHKAQNTSKPRTLGSK